MRVHGDEMLQNLFTSNTTVTTLDNNQKCHPKKINVLNHLASLLKLLPDVLDNTVHMFQVVHSTNQHATMSHVRQNISSADKMITFEATF